MIEPMPDPWPPEGMVEVTQDEFFVALRRDRRDVMPRLEDPFSSTWRDTQGVLVGRTVPGWKNPGPESRYALMRSVV
jgi:hypothetical protein